MATAQQPQTEFVKALSRLDATALVVGSMIGSGIFIVSADILRQVHAPAVLLIVWALSGVVTLMGALAYGELAAMFPRAGGQYVYLREGISPLFGYLYGWTLFLVIQSGTIAAVAVGFARYLGVLVPWISPTAWIVPPINISSGYALSLSRQQLVGVLMIVLLTWINTRGLKIGKIIQNIFTSAKTLSLVLLIVVGVIIGRNAEVVAANFASAFTPHDAAAITPDFSFMPVVSAAGGLLGLIVAFCVAQVGSLFSADAWNNITFTAGEVKDPRRNIPLSLALGTGLVMTLYILASVAYCSVLPLAGIQHAPDDRVATAALQAIFGGVGAAIMAIAIVISTFGCNNGLILAGARVVYAMARDGLFFRKTGILNERHVPGKALVIQGIWTALLVLPRTRLRDASGSPVLDPVTGLGTYGNLYSNLLDYVIFAALAFYVLTIAGIFILRRKRSDAERPYRAWGYPVVPVLYMAAATLILLVLITYRTQTTWPGLVIMLTGVPVYLAWRALSPAEKATPVP